jgi:hypothetical protein
MMRIQVHHLLPHPTCTATPNPLSNTHNTPKAERDEMQMIASIQETHGGHKGRHTDVADMKMYGG